MEVIKFDLAPRFTPLASFLTEIYFGILPGDKMPRLDRGEQREITFWRPSRSFDVLSNGGRTLPIGCQERPNRRVLVKYQPYNLVELIQSSYVQGSCYLPAYFMDINALFQAVLDNGRLPTR
jgi:hypothetical protein